MLRYSPNESQDYVNPHIFRLAATVNVTFVTLPLESAGTSLEWNTNSPLMDPTAEQGLRKNLNVRDYVSDSDEELASAIFAS